GDGLSAEDNGDTVNVGLQLGFPGGGGVSNIALGDCLTSSTNACTGTISINNSVPTGLLWFVTDIVCVGTAIEITKKYIEWNACGLIVGTGM
ncbi:unnamed protein product, partial [marine sediment metagenome]